MAKRSINDALNAFLKLAGPEGDMVVTAKDFAKALGTNVRTAYEWLERLRKVGVVARMWKPSAGLGIAGQRYVLVAGHPKRQVELEIRSGSYRAREGE